MIRNHDPFALALRQFLDAGYEYAEPYPDNSNNPEPVNPLIFYDRHVASTLVLKNIKRAPWIARELAKICENTIKEFTMAGHKFIDNRDYRKLFHKQPSYNRYCDGVADYHFDHISLPCSAYASKLLFSPNDPRWFTFIVPRKGAYQDIHYSFRCSGDTAIIKPKGEDIGDREYDIPPETRSTLDRYTLSKINKLRDMNSIFNYEFFIKAKPAEALLKKMDCWGPFKWEMPTVTGAPVLPVSPPHKDSDIIQLFFPALNSETPRPLSTRKGNTSPKPARMKRIVAPLRRNNGGESKYRINVWANAVETDATFIVFTCGRQERIGIRHRQSQTLYLSDPIDPVQMKEPGYRQMHLGLTIAAIKDRLAMLVQTEEVNQRPSKRKDIAQSFVAYNSMKDRATRRKRRKLNPELDSISLEIDKKACFTFDEELAKRELVLFYLNFGGWTSPAPSSFQRMEPSCTSRPFQSQPYRFKRKASYRPEDYISVVTHEDAIGSGAMGMVYRVTVEIEMEDGSKHQRTLILKLAIGPKKDQIIREYEMYKRLAEADVMYGIVSVHGLFHDMETDAMIMIMDDAGKSLRTRAIEQNLEIHYNLDTSVQTTEEERDAFIKALEGIHSARVIHQDLRIDNLMINDAGDVFIIDFDNAEYDTFQRTSIFEEDLGELLTVIGWLDSDDEDGDGKDEDGGEEDGDQA
ncbi:hypothetical protein JR316_0013327 [Psilocybe cubensis]|uniref:Protein kinase domain-containing protein n=2 Tax=Psilocybe cubensis TaxID=181762 RepID=A0A8H8CHS3_PSICU|nr:hypothetical protein JR316_0013327 [Psilocybe cubensis]KAH9474859.1 hypothetical protein JR316_0013327 [Psilocybe cubensis]